MAGKVDVLAYHDELIRQHQALSSDAYHTQELPKAQAARAAVAELIAAATEVRDAAWGPGKTDQPHILRLDAALSNMEAR